MNPVNITFGIISFLVFALEVYYLFYFIQKVFVTLNKQCLQSICGGVSTDSPSEYVNEYIKDCVGDRSLKILAKSKIYLSKMIFWQGLPAAIIWVAATYLLAYPDFGGVGIMTPKQFFVLLLLHLVMYCVSYIWHSLRLGKYSIVGTQEKLLEEARGYISQNKQSPKKEKHGK